MSEMGEVLKAINLLTEDVRNLRGEVVELRKESGHAKNAAEAAFKATQETAKMVAGLSCVAADTDPEVCPARGGPDSRRIALASMSEEEPHSIAREPMSVYAGKLGIRGPAAVVGVIALVFGVLAAVVFVFTRPLFLVH